MNEKILTAQELQAIRERAAAATPGPWYWTGNIKAKQFALVAKTFLYPIVMGFVRWGNLWGIPQFRNAKRDVMVEAFDLVNKPDHNNKFEGINHPDAIFIAHSREDIDRLLFTVEQYREALEFYGDMFNWGHPMTDGAQAILAGCFLPGDNGERARQVLAITADKQE